MTRRGWCPSVHAPMASGDGLLLRVKPRGALSRDACLLIAEIAERHGNGAIDLTSGANLQLRGFTASSVPPARSTLIAAGLADADVGREARRNIILPALAAPAAKRVAEALECGLAAEEFAALPGKFCFLVEDGSTPGMHDIRADIAIRLGPPCIVQCDGDALGFACAPEAAANLALSMARGLGLRMREADRRGFGVPDTEPAIVRGGPTIGRIGVDAIGVAPEFGRLHADTLRQLGVLAGEFSDGELRVSPCRTLVLGGVNAPGAALARASSLGFITDPADPRLRIAACPGAPDCASASVALRDDARHLAAALAPGSTRVHLSGCAKGCAHPAAAALVFVGVDGRYDVVRHGRAGDPPFLRGLARPDPALVPA